MIDLLQRCRLPLCVVLLALACLLGGCSRTHYRTQADMDARNLVLQKAQNPMWMLPDFSIEMDHRSRFFSPYDPDYPPMPPDDPASHQFMRRVDGMKGYSHWYDHGSIHELENPGWQEYIGEYAELTPEGSVKLTLEDSVKIALMHSPDYQEQLETLYLSALDVSTERFRFDTQFFGGVNTTYEHLGSERPGGESNTLEVAPFVTIQKQLPTAGDLLIGFANSTVFQFFGPDTSFTTTVINLNFVQPLLRAGGRAIALEQLTIAERGLLANVRAFQRYRTGFYTRVAVGDLGVSEPQRRGGFFGGTGLTGFSGTGSGGFGGVGEATGFGRSGLGTDTGTGGGVGSGFAGGGAGQVGGYIGLLQQLQQIRNTQDSLNAQTRTLALLEANLAAGLIDIAQVDQFRQSIETERATQLQAQNALQLSLDTFKSATLGLPPDVPVELDDSMIQQFQLIRPQLGDVQNAIADYINEFGDLPREPSVEELTAAIERIRSLRDDTNEQFGIVREDLGNLEAQSAERLAQLTEEQRNQLLAERERLAASLDTLHGRFQQAMDQLQSLEAGLNEGNRIQSADSLVAVLSELLNVVGELSLIQARSRLEAIALEPIELDSRDAMAIASANRLDWMNNRAVLVDTWRLIEFNANALKSRLDVVFDGEISTLGGDNPVAFRGETGRLTAQLLFDAPITRLVERNNFRQQLITYQQARRQLIQFEDGIHRSLRANLRQLDQLEQNLEIQRRAVAIAIRRVEQTRDALNKPVPPALPGQPPAQFGPTAALNLLTALSDLRSSQNNLMSVWLNHHAARLTLLRDLGIMEIDEHGLFVDREYDLKLHNADAIEHMDEEQLPPPIPFAWWEAANDSTVPTSTEATNDSEDMRPFPTPAGPMPDLQPIPEGGHTPELGPAPEVIPDEFEPMSHREVQKSRYPVNRVVPAGFEDEAPVERPVTSQNQPSTTGQKSQSKPRNKPRVFPVYPEGAAGELSDEPHSDHGWLRKLRPGKPATP